MACGVWSAGVYGRMPPSRAVVIQLVTCVGTQASRRITVKSCLPMWAHSFGGQIGIRTRAIARFQHLRGAILLVTPCLRVVAFILTGVGFVVWITLSAGGERIDECQEICAERGGGA